MMKEQEKLTHKEAVKKVLEELGGRARLRDIYPRVIPLVKYKPGSDIRATLRRLL
jgi:ribosomal protein L20A (L18A)